MDEPTEPRLPPELERVTFEMAARSCRTKSLPTLMLVARRVWYWLRPILFETVVITTDRSSIPLDRWPPYPTGPETHHVNRLLIYHGKYIEPPEGRLNDMPDHQGFISQCPNLQDVGIWCDAPKGTCSRLTGALRSPHRTVTPPRSGLLRLSVDLRDLFPDRPIDFTHEIFRDLTHLEVLDSAHSITWEEGNNYSCLHKLMHLAFIDSPCFDVIRRCLRECKELQVLILSGLGDADEDLDCDLIIALSRAHIKEDVDTGVDRQGDAEARELRGYRIVINPNWSPRHMAETWAEGGDGGDLMWTYCEGIVKERLKHLVK
ncbi:hypothetical protein AX16_004178 [Volvariella volvacea WC 439]|nr:hypothetical protein AX16_004178 [Volvariella volvacea WC 439]